MVNCGNKLLNLATFDYPELLNPAKLNFLFVLDTGSKVDPNQFLFANLWCNMGTVLLSGYYLVIPTKLHTNQVLPFMSI